jgi:hypothetical protein
MDWVPRAALERCLGVPEWQKKSPIPMGIKANSNITADAAGFPQKLIQLVSEHAIVLRDAGGRSMADVRSPVAAAQPFAF